MPSVRSPSNDRYNIKTALIDPPSSIIANFNGTSVPAGDTVWFAPGEKHWHGASPQSAMVHIAMQEALDGSHVAWLEHVTDAQYGAVVGPQPA